MKTIHRFNFMTAVGWPGDAEGPIYRRGSIWALFMDYFRCFKQKRLRLRRSIPRRVRDDERIFPMNGRFRRLPAPHAP